MLGHMGHFEHHRPEHAHLMKHNHYPGYLGIPVMDRSSGKFDGALVSIPSNQDAVRAEPRGRILSNG
jgi:hypothetical protein